MDDESGLDECGPDDSGLDEDGRLDLFGQAGSGGPPDSAWAEEVAAGGDRSDYVEPWEDCGDDGDAWLASLPADIRAEVESRPPVTDLPWEAGAAAARDSLADGGFGDSMLPGWALGKVLAGATVEGYDGRTPSPASYSW